MVKIYTNQNGQLFKVTCLSTDDKPIGVVPANTICEELDTGDKYFYDPVASQWAAYPGGSGGSGSGLPDPTSLPDGTAMVAVDGEWKMQEGYGYTGDPAFEPITWDGDTEGKPYIDTDTTIFYKVSDDIITAEQFIGATMGVGTPVGEMTLDIPESEIEVIAGTGDARLVNAYGYIRSGVAGTYGESEDAFSVPEDGTYFIKNDSYITVKSLTAPPSVHKFDSALIPTSGVEEFVVKFEMGEDGVISDKTWDDVVMAAASGKLAKGVFYEDGLPFLELQFTGSGFANISLGATNTLQIITLGYDGTPVWAFNLANYTLTPDT